MTSPYDLLAALTGVKVHYTDDQQVLQGRRGRWFPGPREIVIDKTLRRLKSRCTLAHELAHAVLNHGPCGGGDLFDYRRELEADQFAARLMLDDLEYLADTLAVTCGVGHAAAELRVTVDLLDTRLSTLTDEERVYIDERVWRHDEMAGA